MQLTAKTDPAWEIHAISPIGTHFAISSAVKLGVLRIPVPHITKLHTIPTTSCAHDTNQSIK